MDHFAGDVPSVLTTPDEDLPFFSFPDHPGDGEEAGDFGAGVSTPGSSTSGAAASSVRPTQLNKASGDPSDLASRKALGGGARRGLSA